MGDSLFWVFFIYGLAFFGLGIAMAMESWRVFALAEARVLLPLAGFGLVHGAHEWLDAYLMQAEGMGVMLSGWVPWLRLGMLVTSFSLLAMFAYESLRMVPGPMPSGLKHGSLFVGVYVVFIITSAVVTYDHRPMQVFNGFDALARYLLAVPASTLAALGLHYIGAANPNSNTTLKRLMNGAAIGFGLYAFTQLFVPVIVMFPANIINKETFLAVTGLPIQVVRAVLAVLITVCLFRATQVTEDRLKAELQASQEARLNEMKQRDELRRELLRHTVRAQEEERSRIARELHDETAQTLTAISLELATLRNNLPRQSASLPTVERLLDLSRQVSQSLYRTMTGLRPAQLDELGVTQAIRGLVARDYIQKGFAIDVEVSGSPRRLDAVVETVLFRVAQEALTNLARHAGVRAGRVELTFGSDQVTLVVSDPGCGYDPSESFRPPRGWGLEGMKDRVESVGGVLKIESAPGRGTRIEARLPALQEGKE